MARFNATTEGTMRCCRNEDGTIYIEIEDEEGIACACFKESVILELAILLTTLAKGDACNH